MDRLINSKIDKSSIYEIYRACRLCGAGAGYKMPIIQNVIDIDGNEVELKQKIRECVQIEVHQDDKMPPLICELCVDKVNDFYVFLELCRQTNKRTRQRLGLPLQSTQKGNVDSGDCILGVTEPVYVKDDDDEPLSRSSPRNSKHKGQKSNKPSVKVKVEKPVIRDSHNLGRGARFATGQGQKRSRSPEVSPRPTRHSRSSNEDNITLSTLRKQSKRLPSSLPPPPKSILKKEPKVEDKLSLRSKRTQEPSKPVVPVKKVKLSVKVPPKPERSKAPPPGVKCPICGYHSKTTQANASHLRSHTVTFTKIMLACNACCEWFPNADAATTHHKRHEARSKGYTCRGCRARHTTYKQYLAHTDSGDCVPWEEVPDVQCSECWKYFSTDNLRTLHKCPGPDGRPGGKCSKCYRTYALLKNLKKHESTCMAKKKGEFKIDPELLAKVKPIQIKTVRCDPLLERVKNEHYDVADVPEDYGLDPGCIYPYINSASLNFNRMVNIKSELHDFFCEEDYIHWDSDISTDDEMPKDKQVDSLTTLTLKTLFSLKCLGRVPRKKRKVKMEKGVFDSILSTDFNISEDIDNIIDNLGDDENLNGAESKTDDVTGPNDEGKNSDVIESVRKGSDDNDEQSFTNDNSTASLVNMNKDDTISEEKSKINGVNLSNDECDDVGRDKTQYNDSYENKMEIAKNNEDKMDINDRIENAVKLNNSSKNTVQLIDTREDKRPTIDGGELKDKFGDSSDDRMSANNEGEKNHIQSVHSTESKGVEVESSKVVDVNKSESKEINIEKENRKSDISTNVITESEVVHKVSNDVSISKNEKTIERNNASLDVNEKTLDKINAEVKDHEKNMYTENNVSIVDPADIDKENIRISDVDVKESKQVIIESGNDKNLESVSNENITELSDEVNINRDTVNNKNQTEIEFGDIKENVGNVMHDIKKAIENSDTNSKKVDTDNSIHLIDSKKDKLIDNETSDKKENLVQTNTTDGNIQKDDIENCNNETEKVNDEKVKFNGDIDERLDNTNAEEQTDSEIDDKKLMDALNEHIGETDENSDVIDDDRKSVSDTKIDEARSNCRSTEEKSPAKNIGESKITLEDLIPSKVSETPSMDLDSISDDEFNFDA